MASSSKQINRFLYAVEGLGAAFVGVFIFVYLWGLSRLPDDVVFHSEPVFRTTLAALGTVLIIVFVVVLITVPVWKRKA